MHLARYCASWGDEAQCFFPGPDTRIPGIPGDIVRLIMEFDGRRWKLRNGRYMDQIPADDPRYALLRAIPKPVSSRRNSVYRGNYRFEVRFSTPEFRRIVIYMGPFLYMAEKYPYYPVARYCKNSLSGIAGDAHSN